MSDKDEFRKAVTARKPGMFRSKPPSPATLPVSQLGEMKFKDAVQFFRVRIVSELVKNHHVTVTQAIDMTYDCDAHKEVLLSILNKAIQQRKLKIIFTRHKHLASGQYYDVLKITDV